MTTIDFNQLMKEAGDGFQPVPDGPYNIEVAKAEATTTSVETGQKPMFRVQLRIIDGPHAGRLVFDNFVVSAGNATALGFFFEHMAAFGLDSTFFASNPTPEVVAQSLIGRSASVTVGTKVYRGSNRNEVTGYRPLMMGAVGAPPPAAGIPTAGTQVPQAPAPAPTPPPAPVATPPVAPAVPQAVPQAAPPQPQPVAPAPAPAAPAPAAPPLPAGVAPPAAPVAVIPPAPAGVAAPVQPEVVAAPPQPAPVPPAPATTYNPGDEEPF